MYVTRISHYIQRSVLSVVSHNHSRSWNILPAVTGVRLYKRLLYCHLREGK